MNYQNIYNQIIERAKTRILEGYKEKHHIIPRCLGGDNIKGNLVLLTAREHLICHLLLCEIYPENDKLKIALWLMVINKNKKKYQRYKISSRMYEKLKKENAIIISKIHKNKKLSKETKLKISKANSKPKPLYFKEIAKKSRKNKRHSEETKLKMSLNSKIKGLPRSIKIKLKISKSLKKIDFSNRNLNISKIKSIPIKQYDLKNNFIREWKSATEAGKELNIGNSDITSVCKNRQKTSGGYIWRYSNYRD